LKPFSSRDFTAHVRQVFSSKRRLNV